MALVKEYVRVEYLTLVYSTDLLGRSVLDDISVCYVYQIKDDVKSRVETQKTAMMGIKGKVPSSVWDALVINVDRIVGLLPAEVRNG